MNEHQSQFLKLLGGSASFSPVFTYLFLFFYFFLSSRGESPRWDPSVCMRVGQVPILLDLQYFPQFCGQMFGNVCFPKAAIHLSLSAANIHSVLTICTTKSEQARSNTYRSHLRAHQSLHKQHKPDFQLKMASVMYLTKNLYITNPVLLLVKWFLKLFFIKHFFFPFHPSSPPHHIHIHRYPPYPQVSIDSPAVKDGRPDLGRGGVGELLPFRCPSDFQWLPSPCSGCKAILYLLHLSHCSGPKPFTHQHNPIQQTVSGLRCLSNFTSDKLSSDPLKGLLEPTLCTKTYPQEVFSPAFCRVGI